jgi:pSer/pThr/pTyr-binding forkhead associated (FHA) protein
MPTLAPQPPVGPADGPTLAEAPTQVPDRLPRISQRDRGRAALTAEQLQPGRYLAIDDGGDVVIISIGPGSMRLGRGQASDVALDDPSVSRRHAVVTRRDDAVVLWDDRSLNGVLVNGERVQHAALQDGDAIALGNVQMRFIAVD